MAVMLCKTEPSIFPLPIRISYHIRMLSTYQMFSLTWSCTKYPMHWDSPVHSFRSKVTFCDILNLYDLQINHTNLGTSQKEQKCFFRELFRAIHGNYIVIHSFHDGNLNFYRPDTTGYYSGSQITGLTSSKVSAVYIIITTLYNMTR